MLMTFEAQVLNNCAPGQYFGGQSAARNRNAVDCLAVRRVAENFCVHLFLQPQAANADIFGIEIIFDALVSAFLAEAGFLHAAERALPQL